MHIHTRIKDYITIKANMYILMRILPILISFLLVFLEKSSVIISYKMQPGQLKTIKDYRDKLVESMFVTALNQRFFKITKRKDPPYFSCSASTDELVRQSKAYFMSSYCKEKGTLEALESMLLEVCL